MYSKVQMIQCLIKIHFRIIALNNGKKDYLILSNKIKTHTKISMIIEK